jgi:hypothetical protein
MESGMKIKPSVGMLLLAAAAVLILASCQGTTNSGPYTIQVTSNRGTVLLSPNKSAYNEGETVNATVYPYSGYQFSSWGGSIGGTSNPTSFTVTGNMYITANYANGQPGTLVVQNNSSYVVYYLYVAPYPVTAWGVDRLGSGTIAANGGSFTLPNLPAGDYAFKATDSNGSHVWQRNSANNIGEGSTYTWTLVN